MKRNTLIDNKDIPFVRTSMEKFNYCIICIYEWIVALFAMVFILPIALLFHTVKLMYLMYTEFYMKFRSYSDEFDFYSIKDIWSVNIKCMFKPQTPHVIKHISFYHVDKPELIEDFIIDCFKEFVESENATDPNVGPALSVKITKEIYEDIKRLEQMYENKHYSLLHPYCNKYDAFKLNIVNRIMKHHKDMWT